MIKNEDTKAILARREAFINQTLSKEEAAEAKGGIDAICLIPQICLTIIDPCVIPSCFAACLIAQPCLTIADDLDPQVIDPQIQEPPHISNGF